jgi:glucokinase
MPGVHDQEWASARRAPDTPGQGERREEPDPGEDHVLAIDVGATKIAAGLVTVSGQVIRQARVRTNRESDATTIFDGLRRVVDSVRSGREIACGIGTAGPFGQEPGTLASTTIPAWRGFPLGARVAEATGLEAYVATDGQAFALAEGWIGAARGESDFVGLVVSTGIGGGIVSGGSLVTGATGNAGHLGHMVVVPGGRPCVCGGRGCIEAEASGWAIAEMSGGSPADAPTELMERSAEYVGIVLASIFNLLDLRLAVIGGSVALGFGSRFFDVARRTLAREARLAYSRRATIKPAALGQDAPLIGAARVGLLGAKRTSDVASSMQPDRTGPRY